LANINLTFAISPYDRVLPLINGEVKASGIVLEYEPNPSPSPTSPVPRIFFEQIKYQRYDVSEMSFSSFLIERAKGWPYRILPVFHNRNFSYTSIAIRRSSGIRQDHPEDLKGKRFAIGDYQQTGGLWIRGVLLHEFGVKPEDLEWWMERTEERSHGGATGFQPPPGLRFHRIPAEDSIGNMLLDGRLDATLLYIADNNLVDRSRVRLEDDPRVRRLFPDPLAEGRRYYQTTGLFPINHGMVVRRSIYEQHPWVALNIFNAFRRAKEQLAARAQELTATHFELGLLPPQARQALNIDPYPYGVRSNRQVLETVAEYSYEQGLTPRRLALEEVFAPSTLDL
jgi:4,5-dihydroxyphthalate decarboxylase